MPKLLDSLTAAQIKATARKIYEDARLLPKGSEERAAAMSEVMFLLDQAARLAAFEEDDD